MSFQYSDCDGVKIPTLTNLIGELDLHIKIEPLHCEWVQFADGETKYIRNGIKTTFRHRTKWITMISDSPLAKRLQYAIYEHDLPELEDAWEEFTQKILTKKDELFSKLVPITYIAVK